MPELSFVNTCRYLPNTVLYGLFLEHFSVSILNLLLTAMDLFFVRYLYTNKKALQAKRSRTLGFKS
jgi:hypothetical protein